MTVLLRPGCETDHPLVVDSWLTSNKGSARARDMLAAGIYWTEHKATVRRLLAAQRLTVACPEEDPDAILGWACTSEPGPGNPDPLVFYVYVRGGPNGARRCGLAKLLLRDFLPHPFTYTHRPQDPRLRIPEHAFYNCERNYR